MLQLTEHLQDYCEARFGAPKLHRFHSLSLNIVFVTIERATHSWLCRQYFHLFESIQQVDKFIYNCLAATSGLIDVNNLQAWAWWWLCGDIGMLLSSIAEASSPCCASFIRYSWTSRPQRSRHLPSLPVCCCSTFQLEGFLGNCGFSLSDDGFLYNSYFMVWLSTALILKDSYEKKLQT